MQLEQRIVGDVAVIRSIGDITLNKGGDVLLKDKVQSLIQQGQKNLVSTWPACRTSTAPASASSCRRTPRRRTAAAR